jgi:hypothetical protein
MHNIPAALSDVEGRRQLPRDIASNNGNIPGGFTSPPSIEWPERNSPNTSHTLLDSLKIGKHTRSV